MKITKNTTVSIGLIAVISAAVFFIATINSKTMANEEDLTYLKQDCQDIREKLYNKLSVMDSRLMRIETTLKIREHTYESNR
jgi:hypothetical protein